MNALGGCSSGAAMRALGLRRSGDIAKNLQKGLAAVSQVSSQGLATTAA